MTQLLRKIFNIKAGELFKVGEKSKNFDTLYEGIFMKLQSNKNEMDYWNAVRLNDGLLYCFNENAVLQIVHGVLNI